MAEGFSPRASRIAPNQLLKVGKTLMANTFTTLNDPSASFGTYAFGINKSGQIVGYYIDSTGHKNGFIYNDGVYTTIDDPRVIGGSSEPIASDTAPQAIDDLGFIVGFEINQGSTEAFRDQNNSFSSNYDTNGSSTYYEDDNDQGLSAGYFTSGQTAHGILYQNDGNIFVQIDDPGATSTYLYGVNNEDQLVGAFYGTDTNYPNTPTSHGLFYNNGTWVFMDAPGAVNGTFARSINNEQEVVGYYVDGNGITHGFLFYQQKFTTIDVPGASDTYLYSINDAGQIVGAYVDSSGNTHGFIYGDGSTFTALPATYALGINSNGQIVGYFIDSNGRMNGFLYSGGKFTLLNDPTHIGGSLTPIAAETSPQGINGSGQVVGYELVSEGGGTEYFTDNNGQFSRGYDTNGNASYLEGNNSQNISVGYFLSNSTANGFIIQNNTQTTIDYPNASATWAYGVNNQDQAVGSWSGTDPNSGATSHGFFYNNGVWSYFDDPNGVVGTVARGINDSDVIVGYYTDANWVTHGFELNKTAGIYTTVDVPGAADTYLYGINDAGEVVGAYVDAKGNTHGFLDNNGAITTLDYGGFDWNQIDNGSPVTMTGGNFQNTGTAEIAASYSGVGTYLYAVGTGWTKIDNGSPVVMTSGDFAGLGYPQLAGVFSGYGTYTYTLTVGWTKIDNGTPALLTSGDYRGLGHAQLAGVFAAYGTYTWSSSTGWIKIDNGNPTLLTSGDFFGTSNGNNNHADLAGYFPGYGTYIWSLATGWMKIDGGSPADYAAGNFLGTSNGNNNQTDLAAYFPGSGTFIWSQSSGWTKIDSGAGAGMTAVDLNGNGQNELLEYFPGSGMYEWQNGTGWTTFDNTSALPTNAQQALFATGNFQGGSVVDAAVAFNGAAGMWLDPPAGATSSGSSAQSDASAAAGPAQVTSQLNPAAFATPIAGPSGTPQPNLSAAFATPIAGSSATPQPNQSAAFAGTIGGLAGQDQPTLGYSANSGNSGAAPTAANVALLGSYMASSFVSSSDGNGGTLISEAAMTTPNPIGSLVQPHASV
jgi:probable HAF family extracellular repeat protein